MCSLETEIEMFPDVQWGRFLFHILENTVKSKVPLSQKIKEKKRKIVIIYVGAMLRLE